MRPIHDSGDVTINSDTTWLAIGAALGTDGESFNVELSITGAGALAHLKVTEAAVPGGTHKDAAIDADLLDYFDWILPPDASTPPHQAAGGDSMQLRMIAPTAAEYRFWAKNNGTDVTVRLKALVVPRNRV